MPKRGSVSGNFRGAVRPGRCRRRRTALVSCRHPVGASRNGDSSPLDGIRSGSRRKHRAGPGRLGRLRDLAHRMLDDSLDHSRGAVRRPSGSRCRTRCARPSTGRCPGSRRARRPRTRSSPATSCRTPWATTIRDPGAGAWDRATRWATSLVVALLLVPPEVRSLVEIRRSMRRSSRSKRHWGRAADCVDRSLRPGGWSREPDADPVFCDEAGSEGHAAAVILARFRPERPWDRSAATASTSRISGDTGNGGGTLPHDSMCWPRTPTPSCTETYERIPLRGPRRPRDRTGYDRQRPPFSALCARSRARMRGGSDGGEDAVLYLLATACSTVRNSRQHACCSPTTSWSGSASAVGRASGRTSDSPSCRFSTPAGGSTSPPGRRDAGAFLELAADLAESTRRTIDLPTEFRELASQKSSSMVAKAARRLLEV